MQNHAVDLSMFDLTGMTVFLASNAARYINGQVIMVDGGFPYFPDAVPTSD